MAVSIRPAANAVRPGFFECILSNTEAGDVSIIPTVGLIRGSLAYTGLRFFGSGPTGWTITVYYTNAPEEHATHRSTEAQSAVPWRQVTVLNAATPAVTDAAGATPTAVKLVFSHAGSCVAVATV